MVRTGKRSLPELPSRCSLTKLASISMIVDRYPPLAEIVRAGTASILNAKPLKPQVAFEGTELVTFTDFQFKLEGWRLLAC